MRAESQAVPTRCARSPYPDIRQAGPPSRRKLNLAGRKTCCPGTDSGGCCGDWREAIVQRDRAHWLPACALPGSEQAVAAETTGVDIGG